MSPVQSDDNYDLVMKGWDCQETDCGVPFFIHKTDGKTVWDHPYYTKVIEELDAYQDVRYAAYRTALKLRHLQKKIGLHLLSLQCLQSVLEDHGFPQGCTGLMDSQCLQLILLDLFHTPDFRHFDSFRQDLASELLHNYLLNLFDVARTGVMKVVSVKVALAALCNSTLTEKYQYFFREIQSSRAFVSRDQLSAFIFDLIQIPDLLKESVAFGKNVSAAVDSCVQVAGTLGDGVPEKGFYAWLMREPQTLIWLPTLHRLITAETVKHDCKCSVCKAVPIVGFRYKCLQCFKFNICQDCFFHCRVAKNHHVRHPIQEYCLPTTAKDETKAFLKVVRNKISGRRRGVCKTAFLPVDNSPDQGISEWEIRAAPTPPSPPSPYAEGEATSSDSGNSSDQGGEGTDHSRSPEEPSACSPRSLYDNSSSPARYLEGRHALNGSAQDRHSLLHLVHRLRRENRLLRQQLKQNCSRSEDQSEMWRSVATAQMSATTTQQSHDLSSPDVTPSVTCFNGPSMSQTVSPIGDVSTTLGSRGQTYTSEFFNSILGTTTDTTAAASASATTLDITTQGGDKQPSCEEMVFASTPALQAAGCVQKAGPRKPPRLTGLGEKNTVSISYIHPYNSPDTPTPTHTPPPFVHRAQVHCQAAQQENSSDTLVEQTSAHHQSLELNYSEITERTVVVERKNETIVADAHNSRNTYEERNNNKSVAVDERHIQGFYTEANNDKNVVDTHETRSSLEDRKNSRNMPDMHNTPPAAKNTVSCDEMWADITPCTIRKKTSKPTRLVDDRDMDDSKTPTPCDLESRRRSTGCMIPPLVSDNCGEQLAATPKVLKSFGSLDKLGFRTPGVDKSLFTVSRGDSILKTPERQEIDKMIEWIDNAFPADLSYSALSLFPDEPSEQKHMLQAAEGIGHAMADLVQATADQYYM